MDLNTLWFILIATLFVGFFILEGFDYGVGILLPFLGKSDRERRIIINSIGPVWDGNEVWILTAGGAIFAAFPEWYATMFSGFYPALLLLLFALIVRAVAFEFRSKDERPGWRATWDRAIFAGSLVPALLWGVALANLLQGVAINAQKQYIGGFFGLLSPYTLFGGLATVAMFVLHGAIYLNLKTTGALRERSLGMTRRVGPITTVVVFAFVAATYLVTNSLETLGVNPGMVAITAALALPAAGWLVHHGQMGWAFTMTCVNIACSVVTIFMALFPRVMVSSLDPAWSLTIYNAASAPYTLKVMTIVTLMFLPVVLGYQAWTYWVFRHRLGHDSTLTY